MLWVRGCQKSVIYLKNTGSDLFEEAYFVVSRDGELSGIGQSDMIYEANRIIDESLEDERIGKRQKHGGRVKNFAIPFLCGILFSTAVYTILRLIFGI